jgi:hypothetical protein
MGLEIGHAARLVQPVIEGEIVDTEYDKDAKQLRHKLNWTDGAGEAHSRWFLESQLEAVENE